jgi:hypothetical protein
MVVVAKAAAAKEREVEAMVTVIILMRAAGFETPHS